MSNGTSTLKFSLFTTAADTTVWGSYVWPWAASYTGVSFNVALGSSGSGSYSTPIYGEIYGGQQTLPTGSYSTSFSGGHTLLQYGYSTAGSCAAGTIKTGAARPPFTVSAVYTPTCSLAASNLNFPTTSLLSSNVDGASTLTVTRSNTTPYVLSLGLGNGAGVTSPTARRMTAGTASITYGLYQDAARTISLGRYSRLEYRGRRRHWAFTISFSLRPRSATANARACNL